MAKLKFIETPLKGAYIIESIPFEDNRGFFTRAFCKNEFEEKGLRNKIVQINHSGTIGKGTIRGLHYQLPPNAETKTIKCTKGRIFDVAVDVRKDSPTFLKWFGTELSEKNRNMFYVPEGFAHGFQSLEEEIEMIYAVTSFYSSNQERGIRYNDPRIGIKWPIGITNLSDKDSKLPLLDHSYKGVEL